MLTGRQEKLLNTLVREYIDLAEPISSGLLKERCDLEISPATIRNELQELTDLGYITQPHTSAGRVPTHKGYQYFIEISFTDNERGFLQKEIDSAKENIQKELQAAQELTKSLTEISLTLNYTKLEDKNGILEILEILGPSKSNYRNNIDSIRELIHKLNNQ
ncbi:MAG: hypothetical protein Q7S10_03490 [bacterium]|nr:hypothetical protein [bacterium]